MGMFPGVDMHSSLACSCEAGVLLARGKNSSNSLRRSSSLWGSVLSFLSDEGPIVLGRPGSRDSKSGSSARVFNDTDNKSLFFF